MLFLNKSDNWDYESEWRIIVDVENHNNNRYFEFPENMLTGVILGCRMPEDNKKTIIDYITKRKSETKIYQAKVNDNKYELDIKEIIV